MVQHIIVAIVFAICLFLIIRRIAHIVANAKKGNPKCSTCTETQCPLRQTYNDSLCECHRERNKKNKIAKKMQ